MKFENEDEVEELMEEAYRLTEDHILWESDEMVIRISALMTELVT